VIGEGWRQAAGPMWANVNAASVQQENVVNLMQIDMMQLSVQQTQMDNICLQATLLMGFALGMWSGETLHQFVEDESELCIWKHPFAVILGHLFFYCVATCISCGVLIVTNVSYIKQAAQRAALTVSTGAAVAVTHTHLGFVSKAFIAMFVAFLAAVVNLIVLFVGMPRRIVYHDPRGDGAEPDEAVLTLWNGQQRIACINPRDPGANSDRDAQGVAIASMCVGIFGLFTFFGVWHFLQLRRSYEPSFLIEWFVSHQAKLASLRQRVSANARAMALAEPYGTGLGTQIHHVGMHEPSGTGEVSAEDSVTSG